MATMARQTGQLGLSQRMHIRRTRGAFSGTLLVLLGVWGALIPFAGPAFHYAYTPDSSWDYTTGRLWLEILPGAAVVVGGMILLMSANRLTAMFGGWLAAAAGAWFVVGQVLSTLWNGGVPAAGVPSSTGTTRAAMEQIGFFSGLGVVVLFLSSLALGRMTVVGVKDLDHATAGRQVPAADSSRATRRPRTLRPKRRSEREDTRRERVSPKPDGEDEVSAGSGDSASTSQRR